MSAMSGKVEQVDHVEVFVPERYEAARWYERILGLEITPGFEDWAAVGRRSHSSTASLKATVPRWG